jgi:hypothetical protein
MGKRSHIDRPVEKKISIPQSVVKAVEVHLLDPLTEQPAHGAWARLVTQLLQRWLAEHKGGSPTP